MLMFVCALRQWDTEAYNYILETTDHINLTLANQLLFVTLWDKKINFFIERLFTFEVILDKKKIGNRAYFYCKKAKQSIVKKHILEIGVASVSFLSALQFHYVFDIVISCQSFAYWHWAPWLLGIDFNKSI
jgi:hypothetical protein